MPTRRLALASAIAALAALFSGPAAPASGLSPRNAGPVVSPVDAQIASALTARMTPASFGSRFSGQVVDVASGRVVWQSNPNWMLKPASTAKLVTATDALTVFGPAHRFTTSVRRGSSWAHVVLVGGGDPSLTTTQMAVLARGTLARLRQQGVRRVKVWYDESLFPVPTLAPGWLVRDVPREVRGVRALVVNRHVVPDTARDAALVFAGMLKTGGVGVIAVAPGRAPAGSFLTATVAGDRLDTIVTHMLIASDNDDAEALHRLVALRVGQPATWAGSALAERAVLGTQGITLTPAQLYDGSGLSRRDRLTAAQLVALVANALSPSQPALRVLATTALPVSGVSGTLRAAYGRFAKAPTACAAGLVHAKTGSLADTVTLAGWTTDAAGQLKAFAFIVNDRTDSLTIKRRVDLLAATITGCV